MIPANSREFDIIILGATGFTGKLLAEYLLNQYGVDQGLTWAMAGRNRQKLEDVRSELGHEGIPILIADNLDKPSIEALAQKTQVICTTVGPYAKYGDLVVEACLEHSTHYCDLCGEVQWIRKMIDIHHEKAKQKGVKIVHCCGFDSVPSDMGVFFMQKETLAQKGAYCVEIKMGLRAMRGGMSGGTYASMSHVMKEAYENPAIGKILVNPYSLNPAGMQEGKDRKDLAGVKYDADFESWKSPFIMAAINTKIVRRSHALAGFPYGRDFRYEEFSLQGKGFSGKWKAYKALFPLAIISFAKPGSLLKKLIDRILPKPGEGPNKEQRENGFFFFRVLGKMKDGSIVHGKVKGDRDPGYGSTSKMLGEAAVCLAKDALPAGGGVITPSGALGESFLQRLQQHAGLSFDWKE
jgi:short subunit dehydrogenase-like uncharacterized protein